MFKTGSVEQALTVILIGRELGIGPTTALSNIVIAAGKPTLGASLVGALIQKSGKYGYTVTKMTDKEVSIEFFEKLANYNGQGVRHWGSPSSPCWTPSAPASPDRRPGSSTPATSCWPGR